MKDENIRESYFLYRTESSRPILVYGPLEYVKTLMSIDKGLGYEGDYQVFSYLTLLELYEQNDKELSNIIIPKNLEELLLQDLGKGDGIAR